MRYRIAKLFGGRPNNESHKGIRHEIYWFFVRFNLECLLFGHLLPDDGDYPICTLCGCGGMGLLDFPYKRPIRHYEI